MRYLLIAVLLTGCAATDRSANMIERYGPTCKGLGFKEGTEAFGNCVLKMYNGQLKA